MPSAVIPLPEAPREGLWSPTSAAVDFFLKRLPLAFFSKINKCMTPSSREDDRVPEKVPQVVPGGFGAALGEVQRGSGEGSAEGFRRLWCRARSGQVRFKGFRRRLHRRSKSGSKGSGEGCTEGPGDSVQGQVRFNGFWRRFRGSWLFSFCFSK